VLHGRPDSRFQSLGTGAKLALRAHLWSMARVFTCIVAKELETFYFTFSVLTYVHSGYFAYIACCRQEEDPQGWTQTFHEWRWSGQRARESTQRARMAGTWMVHISSAHHIVSVNDLIYDPLILQDSRLTCRHVWAVVAGQRLLNELNTQHLRCLTGYLFTFSLTESVVFTNLCQT